MQHYTFDILSAANYVMEYSFNFPILGRSFVIELHRFSAGKGQKKIVDEGISAE